MLALLASSVYSNNEGYYPPLFLTGSNGMFFCLFGFLWGNTANITRQLTLSSALFQ